MSWRRLRGILGNGLLALLSVCFALVLGELLLRRVAPQERPLSVALRSLHLPDPELGYVMAPGFRRFIRTPTFQADVRTNSLGLRDREYSSRHESHRIIVLGDSFVFGIHAGEPQNAFLKRLEANIQQDLERSNERVGGDHVNSVECVNAGVEGYGTRQEVALLKRLTPSLQPDAVVLAFYLGNDFTDNSGRTRMTVEDGYLMLVASAAPYREHARPLQRRVRLHLNAHSDLYLLVKRRLFHPTRSLFRRAHGSTEPTTPKPMDYYVFDAGFANAMRTQTSQDLVTGLQTTREAFHDLRTWCDSLRIPVLLVAIPAEQQVDAEARTQWLRRFGLEEAELDFALPNARLAALAREAHLPLVDLTEAFADHIADGEELYLQRDNHWNAAGHALAAELLRDPVMRQLVQPRLLMGKR